MFKVGDRVRIPHLDDRFRAEGVIIAFAGIGWNVDVFGHGIMFCLDKEMEHAN